MMQGLAAFPYFQEHIEDDLLRPFFRMQVVVSNTEEAVEAKIIKTTQSSLGTLFFDLPQIFSYLLLCHRLFFV